MTRTFPRLRGALVALLALLFGALGLLALAPAAAAQDAIEPPEAGEPAVTVDSVDVSLDETTVVIDVAVAPGPEVLGAVSGEIVWDRSRLELIECVAGDLSVCNDIGTSVAFAGIEPSGYAAEAQLVQLQLAVIDRSADVDVDVVVETVADVRGLVVDDVAGVAGTISFNGIDRTPGGLNGEVLDAMGAGLFGLDVCALGPDGSRSCASTSGLGGFAIDGLVPGNYLLIVEDPNGQFANAEQPVSVDAGQVTVGLSFTLSPAADESPADDEVVLVAPAVEPPEVSVPSLEAADGEIAVMVVAETGGSAVFGVEVCAAMPLVGTGQCGFSDQSGVVRLTGLEPGNYELTASDAAQRFDAPTPVFVGLNAGEGVVAELAMPTVGFGPPPAELAFVEPESSSDMVGFMLFGGAMAALLATGIARRRTD